MLAKKIFHGVLRDSLSATQRKKAICSHVIMRQKFKEGKYDQVKARHGDGQETSVISADKISSPTVVIIRLGHHVLTFDIRTAYLNADITDITDEVSTCSNILAHINASYSKYILADGRMMVKLNKALYACAVFRAPSCGRIISRPCYWALAMRATLKTYVSLTVSMPMVRY